MLVASVPLVRIEPQRHWTGRDRVSVSVPSADTQQPAVVEILYGGAAITHRGASSQAPLDHCGGHIDDTAFTVSGAPRDVRIMVRARRRTAIEAIAAEQFPLPDRANPYPAVTDLLALRRALSR